MRLFSALPPPSKVADGGKREEANHTCRTQRAARAARSKPRHSPTAQANRPIRGGLDPDMPPNELARAASELVSQVTRMAGVVTIPRPEQVSLRQVEFLPLSGDRVLVILVVNDREVQNRVIHTDRAYDEAELARAANFINHEFAGQPLAAIRKGVLESMRDDKARLDAAMQAALDVAAKAFATTTRWSPPATRPAGGWPACSASSGQRAWPTAK